MNFFKNFIKVTNLLILTSIYEFLGNTQLNFLPSGNLKFKEIVVSSYFG